MGKFETLRGHTLTKEVTFVDIYSLYTEGQSSAYRQTSTNHIEKYELQKDFAHVLWKCAVLRVENVNSQEVTWIVVLLDLETR